MSEDENQPGLAQTVKDLMLYGAFLGALWAGVVAFSKWWDDKHELFWNALYGLVVSVFVTAVVWLIWRKQVSPLVNGTSKWSYQFSPWVRWIALAGSCLLLLFVSLIGAFYWDDLNDYVSTPDLAVIDSALQSRFDGEDDDEVNAKHYAMYSVDGDGRLGPGKTAFSSLILRFTKNECCKYAEIVGVSVIVERYDPFGKPPISAYTSEATVTRVIEYTAVLDANSGNYPATLGRQPKRTTQQGNPIIDNALPVSIVIEPRGKKPGLYRVFGELVVKYRGKQQTIRSKPTVLLACFEKPISPPTLTQPASVDAPKAGGPPKVSSADPEIP